jgi:zinc protease
VELSPFLSSIQEARLSNGSRSLFRRRRGSPLATFQVWYKVGSRNEPMGKSGLSHLLEHMMFKGTEKMAPEEFSRIIQAHGGQTNAFTTKDFTAYYVVMAKEKIPVAMDLELERMTALRLTPQDFEIEKSVVMEERRLRTETQPEAHLLEELEAIAFTSHPYRWPIIGWMEDLEALTLEDVEDHLRKHYVPSNLLFLGIADMEPGEWFELLESRFGSLAPGKTPPRVEVREPTQRGERRTVIRRKAEVGMVAMGFHVPQVGHEDAMALEVLACVLAGGKSSRLYRRLVQQEALAVDVGCENPLLSFDPGLFTIAARVIPGHPLERVEHTIWQEVEGLQHSQIQEDVKRAKETLRRSLLLSLDSLMTQAMIIAQWDLCAGWWKLGDYLSLMEEVSWEKVREVALRYLSRENCSVGWLVPQGSP